MKSDNRSSMTIDEAAAVIIGHLSTLAGHPKLSTMQRALVRACCEQATVLLYPLVVAHGPVRCDDPFTDNDALDRLLAPIETRTLNPLAG